MSVACKKRCPRDNSDITIPKATNRITKAESESSGEARSEDEDGGQSPVCEQCSSCSACASQQQQQQQRYIVETITLTTVTERRIVREANEADEPRLSGILKGGKLWKNCENDSLGTPSEDGETASRRSVRFCEDELDGKLDDDNDNGDRNLNTENEITEEILSPEPEAEDTDKSTADNFTSNKNEDSKINEDKIVTPKDHVQELTTDNSELTLTFRLGASVLLSDKLPANSAVRQLFPDSEAQQRLLGVVTSPNTGDCDGKDISESDVPSLPSPGQTCPAGSSSDDEASARTSTQIRRTIERNALRRSLLRCSEPLRRRQPSRSEDNSLVERIRQLTCDVDEDDQSKYDNEQQVNERTSPPGSANKNQPSTYKKLTELFSRRERCHSESSPSNRNESLSLAADNSCCWLMVDPVRQPPDFPRNSVSLPPHTISPTTSLPPPGNFIGPKTAMSRINVSAEARKQFLNTLGERETPPDGSANVGDRVSVTETSYSLEDIDEALGECACPSNGQIVSNQPPDVVATAQEIQQRSEPVDELALFVQRDMGRIERLKKRYSLTDDDQDDYGFSRRPSVRGIKPRFGSTTEILQQIQLQLQPPALACPTRAGSHLTWPYAAEPAPSSPVSSPSEPPAPRRRQPGVPAPRGANGLPVLPEDSYYATVPPQDYRYLEYSTQNGSSYMYASTGNLYARNELVPYNPRVAQQPVTNCDSPPPCVVRAPSGAPVYASHPQQQYQSQMYGTVTRRTNAVPAPVHYSNGTLPHPNYVARNGGRMTTMNYAPQAHARSDSPQRLYHRPAPAYYQAPAAPVANAAPNSRYFPNQPVYNMAPKGYPQQQDLPSPSQRTLSPVPAGSPTRAAKFERGAPEGASASPGFSQDTYGTRMEQVQVGSATTSVGTQAVSGSGAPVAAPAPTSVYYAMNV
ncbi:hypothetical protein B566_EDAN003821 [Ephemera danica]|nr:hypothetical protein B566_EDAN003821 [Ephemera danica]